MQFFILGHINQYWGLLPDFILGDPYWSFLVAAEMQIY